MIHAQTNGPSSPPKRNTACQSMMGSGSRGTSPQSMLIPRTERTRNEKLQSNTGSSNVHTHTNIMVRRCLHSSPLPPIRATGKNTCGDRRRLFVSSTTHDSDFLSRAKTEAKAHRCHAPWSTGTKISKSFSAYSMILVQLLI